MGSLGGTGPMMREECSESGLEGFEPDAGPCIGMAAELIKVLCRLLTKTSLAETTPYPFIECLLPLGESSLASNQDYNFKG